MKLITIELLKRALGIVVGEITDALNALHSTLSSAISTETQRAQQAEQLLLSKNFIPNGSMSIFSRRLMLQHAQPFYAADTDNLQANFACVNPETGEVTAWNVNLPVANSTGLPANPQAGLAGIMSGKQAVELKNTVEGLEAEATTRQQADAQLVPRNIAEALMTNLASYANETTVLLRKQSVATAGGAVEDIYEAMPVVDEETAGICPPTVYLQVLQTAQDVDALKGRQLYYPAALDTESPTDTQLTAIVVAGNGELLDGVTVTDFTYHKDYTYYAATDSWRDRGSSVIAIATNASVGAVRGRNAPGYCAVDPDGSLPLVGWDATQEAISALQSGAVMKSVLPQVCYGSGVASTSYRTLFQLYSKGTDGSTGTTVSLTLPYCTNETGDFKVRKLEVNEINILG